MSSVGLRCAAAAGDMHAPTENILIGEDISHIKIADFGVATMVDGVCGRASRPSSPQLGTSSASSPGGRDGSSPTLVDAGGGGAGSGGSGGGSNGHTFRNSMRRVRGRCHSLVGSLQYMAPEIVGGRGYTCSVDLWSVGVLAHILVAGFPPFDIPSQVRALLFLLSSSSSSSSSSLLLLLVVVLSW
jgi:serine/threonine protein kinase